MKSITTQIVWNKSGTPCSLLFSMGEECGFADMAEFATDAIDSWLPSLRTEVMVRLSTTAWRQLAQGCSDGTIRKEDAGIFSKFLLLSPNGAWNEPDAPSSFESLRSVGFRLFLGRMKLDRQCAAMVSRCEGAELDSAELPKDAILGMTGRLSAAKKTVLVSNVAETHFAKQLLGTTKAIVSGPCIATREKTVPPPGLTSDAADAIELLEGTFQGHEASWLADELVSKPSCSHRLVAMVNAAGIKSQKAVSTSRSAVELLGPQKIKTWMILLLLASPAKHPWAPSIRFHACLRAKMAESFCAREHGQSRSEDLFPLFLLAGAETLLDRSRSDLAKAIGLHDPDLSDFLAKDGHFEFGLGAAEDLLDTPEQALQWSVRFDTGRRDVQKILHASIFWSLSFQSFDRLSV